MGIQLLLSKASVTVVSFSPALRLSGLGRVAGLAPGVLKTDKISCFSHIFSLIASEIRTLCLSFADLSQEGAG